VLLLALDTCDAHGSVSLLRDGDVLDTEVHDPSEDYSVWLLPAVDRVLQAAGIAFSAIELCAVAAGPGSFTGVRVGLTTVKAWSEVRGMGIAVVSRLEAIARQATGSEPWVAAFADARRGQVFAALYSRRSEHLQRWGDEMVIAPEKFLAWAADTVAATPDPADVPRASLIRWISTEPHSLTETPEWEARRSLEESVDAASPILAPVIGRMGYQLALEGRLTDALTLDANYLRRSDAEVSWTDRNSS
jgi:tRNA threonylcarbamoyladenosine biosynthesis protein TsaB